jgi:IclR family transcriptional regulator, acetate operon repressor
VRNYDYTIESVDNALQLLLMLRSRDVLRLSEAAKELGVAHSTAHRLLNTLVSRGFAAQDERRRYVAGPEWADAAVLANPAGRRELRVIARPHLKQLRTDLGETVHLAVLDGGAVRFISSEESAHALRVVSRVGIAVPAYVSSAGKALLAAMEPAHVRSLYAHDPDAPDSDGLARTLAAVRRRGYGTNIGESERGLSAVGVPIWNPEGAAVAAVTLAAPTLRLPRAKMAHLAEEVRRAVKRIEADLAGAQA